MLYLPALKQADLAQESVVSRWCDGLQERIELRSASGAGSARYRVQPRKSSERELWLPAVEVVAHGMPNRYEFSWEFFGSQEYQRIVKLGAELQDLLESGARIQRGDRSREIASFEEALEWMMTEARRGYNIQRYKGLGEMNPEQLWETTMDPAVRRMLRVTIEDAIAADQIFTTLMGDQVEPRREFIETNALAVANLDV